MSDRTRLAILERRRAFVAAALASIGAVSGCDDRPKVCLSAVPLESAPKQPPQPPDAGALAAPEPCLSEPAHPPDAGPIPIACLSVAMPRDAGPGPTPSGKPKPRPCLSMLPND